MSSASDIWKKVDYSVLQYVDESREGHDPKDDVEKDQRARSRRRLRIFLDVLSLILWSYAVLKLLFFDVDQWLVDEFFPWAQPVVTFRFFVTVAVAVAVVLTFKRYYWGLLYLVFFPFILLLWKLPRVLYRSKSWVALFAVVNVLAAALGDFRRSVVTKGVAILSVFFVVIGDGEVSTLVGTCLLAMLLIYTLYRTIRISIQPSRFVTSQQVAIEKLSGSEPMRRLVAVSDDLKNPSIQQFDRQQLSTFTMNLSIGVLAHKGILFWAHKLENYRRSPAALLMNGLAYIWLFLEVVLFLAFINLGIHKMDPNAFSSSSESFVAFLNYSLTSLYGGETSALQAVSELAMTVKFLAGLIGVLILATLLLALLVTYRHGAQDLAMEQAIGSIRQSAKRYSAILREEYAVSVEEATDRLEKLGAGIVLQAIMFLSSQLPEDYEEA